MADVLLGALDPAVGVLLGLCGVVLTVQRRSSLIGPLMLLACGCWFLGSAWSFALFLHRGPLIHVHISYPTGRLRRPLAMVTVAAAYAAALIEAVARQPWITLAMSLLVALAAVDIYTRTSGPARKAGGPALAAALTFATVLGLSAANQLLVWESDRLISIGYDLAVGAVTVLLTADLLWGRWTEATVSDFVVQLGQRDDTGSLTAAVRQALGDPTAVVGFWMGDEGQYLDDRGRPIDLPADRVRRTVVEIDDQGAPAAVLIHDSTVSGGQQPSADIATVVRIAVGNVRLRAQVRHNLDELDRIRRRLVEAADVQRQRVGTELADGPQRRLTTLAGWLDRAVHDAPDQLRPQLQNALAETRLAQTDLRELAEGIRPTALVRGGLAAALPLLVARIQSAHVRILAMDRTRLDPAVEGAVYFVCAEALTNLAKHSQAHDAALLVTLTDDVLTAKIEDDGIGGANPDGHGLRGLRDRVEALGGRLRVADRAGGGTVVEARIPIGPHR